MKRLLLCMMTMSALFAAQAAKVASVSVKASDGSDEGVGDVVARCLV